MREPPVAVAGEGLVAADCLPRCTPGRAPAPSQPPEEPRGCSLPSLGSEDSRGSPHAGTRSRPSRPRASLPSGPASPPCNMRGPLGAFLKEVSNLRPRAPPCLAGGRLPAVPDTHRPCCRWPYCFALHVLVEVPCPPLAWPPLPLTSSDSGTASYPNVVRTKQTPCVCVGAASTQTPSIPPLSGAPFEG